MKYHRISWLGGVEAYENLDYFCMKMNSCNNSSRRIQRSHRVFSDVSACCLDSTIGRNIKDTWMVSLLCECACEFASYPLEQPKNRCLDRKGGLTVTKLVWEWEVFRPKLDKYRYWKLGMFDSSIGRRANIMRRCYVGATPAFVRITPILIVSADNHWRPTIVSWKPWWLYRPTAILSEIISIKLPKYMYICFILACILHWWHF